MTRFGHMFGASLHDLVADILRAIHAREVATRDNGRGGRKTLYTVHRKIGDRWRRGTTALGHPHTRENDRRKRQRLRIEAKRAEAASEAAA